MGRAFFGRRFVQAQLLEREQRGVAGDEWRSGVAL